MKLPGRKNPARRAKAGTKHPKIGRRKTVRTKAGGLISRRSRKSVKRALFRESNRAKALACHACSRNDFATEKSLKAHTAKFHTPGAKSPRGFRTRRDPKGLPRYTGQRPTISNGKFRSLYKAAGLHSIGDMGDRQWMKEAEVHIKHAIQQRHITLAEGQELWTYLGHMGT